MTTNRTNERLKQALFTGIGEDQAVEASDECVQDESRPGAVSGHTADLLAQLGKAGKVRKVPLIAHVDPRIDSEIRKIAAASNGDFSISEVANRLLAKALGISHN